MPSQQLKIRVCIEDFKRDFQVKREDSSVYEHKQHEKRCKGKQNPRIEMQ